MWTNLPLPGPTLVQLPWYAELVFVALGVVQDVPVTVDESAICASPYELMQPAKEPLLQVYATGQAWVLHDREVASAAPHIPSARAPSLR